MTRRQGILEEAEEEEVIDRAGPGHYHGLHSARKEERWPQVAESSSEESTRSTARMTFCSGSLTTQIQSHAIDSFCFNDGCSLMARQSVTFRDIGLQNCNPVYLACRFIADHRTQQDRTAARFESSAWTAMPPHPIDKPTARVTDHHLLVNRGLQQPLACGHPAVSARLTYAATAGAVADHSSIAGDLPQRPASDEEHCLIPARGGVHHLMPLKVP